MNISMNILHTVFYTFPFVTSMYECNMIILAACLIGTLLGRQIVHSMHKKMVKENSLGV